MMMMEVRVKVGIKYITVNKMRGKKPLPATIFHPAFKGLEPHQAGSIPA